MAIGSVGSGTSNWAIQRPDPKKALDELFNKVDPANPRTSPPPAAEPAPQADAGATRQDSGDSVRQLADQLDNQFNDARIRREPTAQQMFSSLDTEGDGTVDQAALQSAMAQTSPAASADAQTIVKAFDTDGDNQLSEQEFTDGVEQAAQQEAGASATAGNVSVRAGGPPPAATAGAEETYDAADTNKDGTVSLQELVAYQAGSDDAKADPAADTSVPDDNAAVMKLAAQVAETYRRFDPPSVAEASTRPTISDTA